jgi:hypothetical protein
MPIEIADLETISTAFLPALPKLSIEEQRLGLALYRQLARGQPVEFEAIVGSADLSADDVATLSKRDPLRALIYRDDRDRVVGFAARYTGVDLSGGCSHRRGSGCPRPCRSPPPPLSYSLFVPTASARWSP